MQQSFITQTPISLSQHPEWAKAVQRWHVTLFNANSEGIDDEILRQTRPSVLLHLAATIVMTGVQGAAREKILRDVLSNGLAYMLDPLLNWTLVGVIKALLRDIFEKE